MIKISIIVPVYNVEKYIEKCIESIINQTFKELEIILVNDGSTDDSGKICDKYADKDNRIKVIHKENGGLSSARNCGLETASAEFIGFVDSDDWIEVEMFERLYDIINKHNADIVQCGNIDAYTDDTIINNDGSEEIKSYNSKQIIEYLLGDEYSKQVVVWNKLYRRSLFKEIKFPEGKRYEDSAVFYKLFYKSKRVVSINKEMYYYRIRENSICRSEFSIKNFDSIDALKGMKEYFKINENSELIDKSNILICNMLRFLYINVLKSNIDNKNKLLKDITANIKEEYLEYLNNKNSSFKDKIVLTLFLLNVKSLIRIYYK